MDGQGAPNERPMSITRAAREHPMDGERAPIRCLTSTQWMASERPRRAQGAPRECPMDGL